METEEKSENDKKKTKWFGAHKSRVAKWPRFLLLQVLKNDGIKIGVFRMNSFYHLL